MTSNDLEPKSLEFSTFDIIKRGKRINLFKIGPQSTSSTIKKTFKALAESYNEEKYRFEFKPLAKGIML